MAAPSIVIIPSFKGDLVTSDDTEYSTLLQRWAKNSIQQAKVIACPKDVEDVRLVLEYAKRWNHELVVKCGGHSSAGGASSNGIVLDLSKYLNTFEIAVERKTVRVDGGCRFEPVEVAALKHGLMIAAGTVNDPHTRWRHGLAIREHGMMVDNLLSAQVITGTGDVKDVSGDDDLFWAIRGGGAGSGVVTSLTYQLHEQREDIFWGVLAFEPEQLPAVIRFANGMKARPEAKAALYIKLFAQAPHVRAQPFYNGSVEQGRAWFKDLPELPAMSSTVSATRYTNMTTVPSLCKSHNCNCGGVAFPSISEEAAVAVLERLLLISKDPDFAPTYLTIEFFDKTKLASVARDATAYNGRTHDLLSAINIRWDGKNDAEMEAKAKEHRLHIAALLQSGGDKTAYANYDSTHANREQLMYGDNCLRLRVVKVEYDPDGIFSRK